MKVTINFEDGLIDKFVQEHLETGVSVSNLVVASIAYFQAMREIEQNGNVCGYGDKQRFRQYNTEISPAAYLIEVKGATR